MKAKILAEFEPPVAPSASVDDGLEPGADLAEDGRRLRRDRNREAVVDALLALYAEGDLDPSAAEIAERAGLSPRSLFRYFTDVDDLCRVAVTRQFARVRPLADIDVAASAPVAERVAALVASRSALFETIGTTGSVARMRAHFQPVIATELTRSRAILRRQVASLLAPELEPLGPNTAHDVVAAADVLLSYEAHRLLRLDQGLSPDEVAQVWTTSLNRLLGLSPT